MISENTTYGKISIVIPVYNAEKFIGLCIDSVLEQSYKNIELILVNDASTDGSLSIMKDYADKDSRIKIIDQKTNVGPAQTRNLGIERAVGEFIFFLDADDQLYKGSIDTLLRTQKEGDYDLVIGNFNRNIRGSIEKYSMCFPDDISEYVKANGRYNLTLENTANYLMHYMLDPGKYLLFAYCWGRLYKSTILKEYKLKFDLSMNFFEDVTFNIEYLKHARDAMYIGEEVYNYTIHNNYDSAGMRVSNQLFYNINKLRLTANDFFNYFGLQKMKEAYRVTAHGFIHLLIVHIVRMSGHANKSNFNNIDKIILDIVKETDFQECLKLYKPQKGNSKLLPLLMKYKKSKLILYLCKFKAHRRYGRG